MAVVLAEETAFPPLPILPREGIRLRVFIWRPVNGLRGAGTERTLPILGLFVMYLHYPLPVMPRGCVWLIARMKRPLTRAR